MGCLPSKQQPKKLHHLAENCIVPREKNVTDDYDILKQIGRGSIGKIFLAEAKQPDYCNDEDTVRDQSMAHTSPGSPSWSIPSNDGKESALFLHDSSSTRSSRRKRQYYAIKEIDACCMIDVRAFDSLKTEIAVLRKLDHPYIIKFFGSYSVDCERLSVVMELCLGGSLDQGAPYPEATVKILVANVAEAVLYLHKHKVIHRDLKNENVMFADESKDPHNIRLLDFGLAKVFAKRQAALHDRAGTIYTMSPEALRGEYNEQADMWSLGVMTYHLLSGRRPFWGADKKEIAQNVAKARYSFDGPEWKPVSRQAKSFIRELLEIEPILRSSPIEALNSSWLRRHTETNIKELAMTELGVLQSVTDSNSPMKEIKKLALYAVAHKAQATHLSKLRELFMAIDRDRKGEITLAEMKSALKGDFADKEIEDWFQRADIDQGASINFTEFVASSLATQSELSSQDILHAFRVFDRDDSGYITAGNLRESLQTNEGEYINRLIQEADVAGDGQISFREFRNLLIKNPLAKSSRRRRDTK